ncbi:hypothetical protein SERLA73DRAFT_177656 [Serpula lacrymans var. lacrymans S7.3]|uniref:Uncharacterized protein n=2 Tax=Serpula lacrymans var. lacrymans TaxID=341189 RepID=F8PPA2_SERL3|nr:uncharacterized protein SERLADRAFT_461365 [Serpula lacrymans var. lacrymans S7.9]EGO01979.1 hypothetical protein SERLA73DRAFT_177656 [Serpula lacrymans var. lacrymans S7.3]EGO27603.1 hypothetical protein SERLADRAFT_461365 [Serpula lacrymans var. lacrymans S7.9]
MPSYAIVPSSSHHGHGHGQPIVYPTSRRSGSHSRHGHRGQEYYTDGTPVHHSTSLRRHVSAGYQGSYATPVSTAHYTPSSHHSHHHGGGHHHSHSGGANYYTVPASPRLTSGRSRHHHSSSMPPVIDMRKHGNGHHIVQSDSGRHHGYYDAHPSHGSHQYRTPSMGERFRSFFGMDPSYSSRPAYQDPRHHQSKHRTRKGLWCFGAVDHRGLVDKHGREVDHRGRLIHKF